MFALEISYRDGISVPETLLVRRSNALIGSGNYTHLSLEGLFGLGTDIRIIRGFGREFYCIPICAKGDVAQYKPPFVEGVYQGSAELILGRVVLRITSLDTDFFSSGEEALDQMGVEIVRRAFRLPSPHFPALVLIGATPTIVSFHASESLVVGRAANCLLRIDSSDVSREHARFGLDRGVAWVEDLGSRNGTYYGIEKISGRRQLDNDNSVLIGGRFHLKVVKNEQELLALKLEKQEEEKILDGGDITAQHFSETQKLRAVEDNSPQFNKEEVSPQRNFTQSPPSRETNLEDRSSKVLEESENYLWQGVNQAIHSVPSEASHGVPRIVVIVSALILSIVFAITLIWIFLENII